MNHEDPFEFLKKFLRAIFGDNVQFEEVFDEESLNEIEKEFSKLYESLVNEIEEKISKGEFDPAEFFFIKPQIFSFSISIPQLEINDISEKQNDYEPIHAEVMDEVIRVIADLPDVEEEDIAVILEDDVLQIQTVGDKKYKASITLNTEIEGVDSRIFNNGVLELVLKKQVRITS
jgi:HSP20 family molecular chaperone IbpA